jgi:hypothetical protein
MVKILISLEKRHLYFLFFAIGILVLVGIVTSYNPGMSGGTPAIMGHSSDEVMVNVTHAGSWQLKSLQAAINDSDFGGNVWVQNGNNISYTAGNVGIGTTTPAARLDVNGTIVSTGLTVSSGTVSLPAGQIDSAEVSFNYAGSSTKGGVANSVPWSGIQGIPAGIADGDQVGITDIYFCVDHRWVAAGWDQTRANGNRAEWCENNWGNCNWLLIGSGQYVYDYGNDGIVFCNKAGQGQGIFLGQGGLVGFRGSYVRVGIFTAADFPSGGINSP